MSRLQVSPARKRRQVFSRGSTKLWLALRREPLLFVTLATNLAMLGVYLGVAYPDFFNSDSAIKVILAHEVRTSGDLFPSSFYYANSLKLIHGHLTILALSPMLGTTGLLPAIAADLVLAAVFVAVLWRVSVSLGFSLQTRLLVVLGSTAGLSPQWAEFVFGHGGYGYLCLLVMLTLLAGSDYLLQDRPGSWSRALAASAFFLVGLYGLRGLALCFVPSLVALAFSRRPTPWSRVSLVLASTIFGRLARFAIVRSVKFSPFAGTFWQAGEERPAGALEAVLSLFELLPAQKLAISHPLALLHPLRFLLLMVLVFVTLASVPLLRRSIDERWRYVLVYHLALAVISIYLVWFIRELSEVPRYLIPATLTAIIAAGVWWQMLRVKQPARWLASASVLTLLLSVGTYLPPFAQPALGDQSTLASHQGLIEALERAGVRRGYATYWHAPVVTAATAHKLQVYPIVFSDGLPAPFLFQSIDRWYMPGQDGPIALIVWGEHERVDLDRQALSNLIGPPDRLVEEPDFVLLIYENNRLSRLGTWQMATLEAGLRTEARLHAIELSSQEGVAEEEGTYLVSNQDASLAGAMAFGPYVRLPPGDWEIIFDLEATAEAGTAPAHWNVATGGGSDILASGVVQPSGRQLISCVVTLPKRVAPPGLETRVFVSGKGRVVLHGVRIRRISAPR